MPLKRAVYLPRYSSMLTKELPTVFLYSLSVGLYNYGNNFSSVGDLPVNDRLYILQHKIIKQLAEKENFVVVGRCADYVLKDNPKLVKVYIYADLDKRIKRAVDRQDIDPARAKQAVLKADKNRANYYSFIQEKMGSCRQL